jgi:SAM-dependent methyltransferase
MPPQRIDYNRIAERYDDEAARQRPCDPKLVELCNARGITDGGGLAALDIGCGTGIQLLANRAKYPRMKLVGLDLHGGMLDVARRKAGDIDWIQGDAALLPFESESFDYVSAQFCFHHVQEKSAMLREVFRVLRPEGRFTMLNIAPWRMRDWEVYRYFPEAFARDERDCWQDARLVTELGRTGFRGVSVSYDDHRANLDLRERLEFYRQRYSPSQIVALPDAAFEAGLARIEAELEAAGQAPVSIPSHVCLATITAKRP